MTEHAQRIITSGRLITFDEDQPSADALAIRDGEIVAVGSTDDVANLAGPETVIHDAGGATVLPGFIESHVHLFQGAAELDALNLMDVNGADSLKDTVEKYAATRGNDPLLYGVCCDYGILGPGNRHSGPSVGNAANFGPSFGRHGTTAITRHSMSRPFLAFRAGGSHLVAPQ